MPDSAAQQPTVPSSFGPMLLAALLFGGAIYYSRGEYTETAIVPVVGALIVVAIQFAQAAGKHDGASGLWQAAASMAFAACFGSAFFAFMDAQPIIYPHQAWTAIKDAQLWALVLVLTYIPFLWGRLKERAVLRHVRFAAFGLLLAFGGSKVITISPEPVIDVWTVQQAGAAVLSSGENPYTTIRMADSHTNQAGFVPYVYPPTQVYLTLPAWKFAGDVRYSMLVALLATGTMLRLIARRGKGEQTPSILEDAPALMLWLSPKLPFILEQSWVDPMQLMLITAAFTAAAYRKRRLTTILLGVVLTAKQTMFWAVGIVGLSLGLRPREWLVVAGVGAAAVLPFAIWNFEALRYANFTFLNGLPPRSEALTVLNWAQRVFHYDINPRIAFPLTALVVLAAFFWFRGSLARTAIAVAFAYAIFFMFNKWAFANYYFLLMGLACLAAACAVHTEPGWEGWWPPLGEWFARLRGRRATASPPKP
ncbi:MAG: hypothetical protein ACJ790_21640 [Myxococcaceae bacterium]